jgi:glycine oxidase
MLDYIIVGQGLAGSLLSFMLLKKGKKIAVVDNNFSTSSSMAAAGIINPITGRHFVKSWKTDELYPVFTQTYLEISELIQKQIFQPKNVSILFREVENLNNWLGRSTDANLDGFHSNNIDQKKYLETFGKDLIEVVDFNFSGRCDLKSLLVEWKKYLKNIQIPYLEEEFDYNSLELNDSEIAYKNLKAGRLVFCEGAAVIKNPYFNYLPFWPSKGEALIVEIPAYPFAEKMVKDGIFIIHLENDKYWVGSTYNKTFPDENPTEVEYDNLMDSLSKMLKIPFTVIDHIAAIRPTVRDRKPFLGQHPACKLLYIFNGLGAKGSSLGPFFAKQFCEYLEEGRMIDKDVDINRIKISKKS